MKAHTHVLVATDFSGPNEAAIHRAADLARQCGARLTLLHVIEHVPFDAPLISTASAQVEDQPILRMQLERAEAAMRRLVERLGLEDAAVEILPSMHSARRTLLDWAQAHGVDLIVVAPHGRGLVDALGSTAVGVVTHARCDVMVVRGG